MKDTNNLALYATIKKAIKKYGSADAFLKVYYNNKNRKVLAFKKHSKRSHKQLMRLFRVQSRIEKGLPVYNKGGTLLIAANVK